uniref:Uncharacterized protein n=1 Tax=Oscillatoriales cyanobacterium SpSt-418 TaxID=2282169 RepID=A0A7C3KAM5_9CYAN
MRFLLLIVVLAAAAGAQHPPIKKVQRLPFQKKQIALKAPTNYAKRFVRVDPKTGQEIYYDPKPRVELLDAKSGKYALKWIGYDGKEKMVTYQRPDAIDAVVMASVSKMATGQYMYIYNIQNLESSGQNLASFSVQNYASDVKSVKIPHISVGKMSKSINEFKSGNWVDFGIFPNFRPAVLPGRSVKLKLESSAPPGLVECRITGGKQGIEVVGEEPPEDLLDILPGYEAWPSGYTIGPIDSLKALSPSERAKYILKLLPQFHRLGWITADALRWYEQNLTGNNWENIYKRADQDLKAGDVTTEVFSIIQGMRH